MCIKVPRKTAFLLLHQFHNKMAMMTNPDMSTWDACEPKYLWLPFFSSTLKSIVAVGNFFNVEQRIFYLYWTWWSHYRWTKMLHLSGRSCPFNFYKNDSIFSESIHNSNMIDSILIQFNNFCFSHGCACKKQKLSHRSFIDNDGFLWWCYNQP
jgi:hypothetical protein